MYPANDADWEMMELAESANDAARASGKGATELTDNQRRWLKAAIHYAYWHGDSGFNAATYFAQDYGLDRGSEAFQRAESAAVESYSGGERSEECCPARCVAAR